MENFRESESDTILRLKEIMRSKTGDTSKLKNVEDLLSRRETVVKIFHLIGQVEVPLPLRLRIAKTAHVFILTLEFQPKL